MPSSHGPAVSVASALCLLLLAADAPTASNAKALAKAQATVLEAAVKDLKQEYAAHQKDPDESRLRPQSNYFRDHPVELSPDSVLDALERPISDDPRLSAYVRWQLLSGAPAKFDEKLLPRVLRLYESAPQPWPRFGVAPVERAQLDALLTKARREDEAPLSVKLEERFARDSEENKPVLAYRSELYARLPASYESLVAGLRDAHERAAAAAGGGAYDEHAKRVVQDAQAWAQSGSADPRQCGQLADLVARLRFERSPPYYARAAWRNDRLSWSTRTDAVYSPKKLSDLEKVLREAQKNGAAQQAAQRNDRAKDKVKSKP